MITCHEGSLDLLRYNKWDVPRQLHISHLWRQTQLFQNSRLMCKCADPNLPLVRSAALQCAGISVSLRPLLGLILQGLSSEQGGAAPGSHNGPPCFYSLPCSPTQLTFDLPQTTHLQLQQEEHWVCLLTATSPMLILQNSGTSALRNLL